MRLLIALQALISHWRRKPGQLATLIIGLSLATGLWTGVQAINSEARHSYAEAGQLLQAGQSSYLRAKNGTSLSIATFARLRRAGWLVSPVLEGSLVRNGQVFTVIGIEPMTLDNGPATSSLDGSKVDIASFLSAPGIVLVSDETAKMLENVEDLPQRVVVDNQPPNTITTDIVVAENLLGRKGQISRLILLPDQLENRPHLVEIAPELEEVVPETASDISKLTDSFHLNLTAFGLLAFAVGLFIVHGTIGLAFEQRRTMFRTLRVLGLSAGELTLALALELILIALLSGLLGVALGYCVAALLLPDVAATLSGLYGAKVAGALSLRAQWWASGLAISLIGTFIAAFGSLRKLFVLPVLAAAKPRAWAMASQQTGRVQALSGLGSIAVGLVLYFVASGLVAGFMIVGTALLGFALLMPWLILRLLTMMEKFASQATIQWFWADTRQQIPGLSLALMALLLALAANIGVGTMVGSFRTTFTGWLDQRLVSELYVRGNDQQQADAMLAWLKPQTDAVLPIFSVDLTLYGQPGAVYGFTVHPTYTDHWPMLEKTPTIWDDVAAGNAVLINEQLARRNHISTGDRVELGDNGTFAVGGVYSDYGNPQPQVMVASWLLQKWYPQIPILRHAVRVDPAQAEALAAQIRQKFALDSKAVVNQSTIKQASQVVFDRTFAVTDALNIFTLAVAGFAMFTSLLTLATMRVPQLAPVWALGLTRKTLAQLELARVVFLALVTVILAVPAGLVLAWLLLSVVNVEAFGWKLPMHVFIGQWVQLGLLALVAAVVAAGIPSLRLARLSPAELVKVFAHER